jgi:hypothetical protein
MLKGSEQVLSELREWDAVNSRNQSSSNRYAKAVEDADSKIK